MRFRRTFGPVHRDSGFPRHFLFRERSVMDEAVSDVGEKPSASAVSHVGKPACGMKKRPIRALKATSFIGCLGLLVVFSGPPFLTQSSLFHGGLDRAFGRFGLSTVITGTTGGWFRPVTFQGIELTGPEGKLIVRIKEIRTSKGLLGFLTGDSDPGEITLIQPEVTVHLDEDGKWPSLAGTGVGRSECAFCLERGSLKVIAPWRKLPIVDLADLNIRGQIREEAPGQRYLTIDPIVIADHLALAESHTEQNLALVAPILAKVTRLTGSASVHVNRIHLPLDQPLKTPEVARDIAAVPETPVASDNSNPDEGLGVLVESSSSKETGNPESVSEATGDPLAANETASATTDSLPADDAVSADATTTDGEAAVDDGNISVGKVASPVILTGRVEFHSLNAELRRDFAEKIPMLSAVPGLATAVSPVAAKVAGPLQLEVLKDSVVEFGVSADGISHSGMVFLLPEIAKDFCIESSGVISMNESIDLSLQFRKMPSAVPGAEPTLFSRMFEKPMPLQVTATVDEPVVSMPAGMNLLDELARRIAPDQQLQQVSAAGAVADLIRATTQPGNPASGQEIAGGVFNLIRSIQAENAAKKGTVDGEETPRRVKQERKRKKRSL